MKKKKNNTVHTHILEDGTAVTHTHEAHHAHSSGTEVHEHDHGHTHTHENTKAVLNRLSRAIGHLESIRRMVEDGRDCSEVLIQVSAVNAALNSFNKVLLANHIRTCVAEDIRAGKEETIDELVATLQKLMK